MDIEVLRQAAVVKEVNGDVVIVSADGDARKAKVGDTIAVNDIVLTASHASIVLDTVYVSDNCLACSDNSGGWVTADIDGDVSIDVEQLEDASISGLDIDAIQEAILAGADPTEILEATAAGGGAGSANAGFVTIEYNGAEVLASTFFETNGISGEADVVDEEQARPLVFAAGGNNLSETLVEGSISLSTYPQSITSSTTIFAGDLPLDSNTFVPTAASLSALLAELNSDITSGGQAVSFRYDSASNAIIGELGGLEVVNIDIDATNIGKDVNLQLTTTIYQPIDHVPSIAGGLVSIADDQVSISFEISGSDTGGNPIQLPVSAQVTIADGDNPAIESVPQAQVSESALTDGSIPSTSAVESQGQVTFSEGSDTITKFVVDVDAFNTSANLTSQGYSIELREDPADSGTYLGVYTDSTGSEVTVFTFSFDTNTKGSYTFELSEALDHPDGQNNNELIFSLPIFAIDSDNDRTPTTSLNVVVTDDVQLMQNGSWTITEPNSGEAPTTATIDVMPAHSADGATITEFKFGDNPTQQLDQSITGEQKFDYPEGSLYITLDGEMRFEPNRDLDHENGDIVKDIVVTSGDFDKDSVSATVTLTIQDGDDPVINTMPSVSLSESQLTDGSAPSGSAVQATGTISYTEGSDNLSHFRLEPSEFNTDGSLKSNGLVVELREEPADSGQYIGFTTAANGVETTVFTLNFDGTNKGDYTFTLIEAIDHANADGNNDLSFALPVYMVDSDGDNSAKADLDITITDDVQLMQNGSWIITEPNQGENPTTATFDVMPAHSADGATITEFKFGDNPAQLLDQNVTGEQKFDYPEGSLYITLDGEMRFEPNRDLDHENGDIVKKIVVTSGDFDKDSVSATVTLTIQDGDDPVINSVPSVSLSESQLIDGSVPSGSAVQATGTISYTEGSDNLSHFRLEPSEFNTDGSLKSNGLVIELREDPADSGQYIGFTTAANGAETTVFTLNFDASNKGDYTFTLIEALDHANADGNNDLSFALPVYLVDSDGDNSAKADLDITITDDVQLMQNGSWTITEPNQGENPTTATIDVMPVHSADGATITEFKFGDNPTQQLDQNITGEQKFDYPEGALYITLDGEMRFEPNRDLDHSAGDIVKNIVVTSGDFDKDTVSATVTLTIQDGDDPVINTVPSVSLSEAQLADGSAPSGSAVQATGTINYTEGSDNLSHFRLEPSEFNTDGSLKSNGLVVELREEPADSGQYIGFTTAANGVETTVFTLDFNDADYTFTLIEAIDHANANGNDDLSFALPIYMVDSDGDNSAKADLDITITDDVQLMQNGSWIITEPNVGETPTTATFDVMPAHSADGATISEFKFGDNPTQQLDQSITGEQKFDYPEGSLYITLDGEMRFEPNRDLDHENGDIVKDIVVTSGDFDKDSVSATVTLTIQDGDDPVINTVPSVSLSESQLADGSAPSGSAVQATGTISYTEGSDNLSHFRLEPTEFNTDGLLKSNGLVVELREEPADSGQYIGFTTAATGVETTVFTLSFDGTNKGDYTFTLIEAIDHANADGNNDLSFALPVYMVDSDGDNSAKANLDITITDDVQLMQNGSWTITEPNQGENPTTATIDVMPAHSADGATITEFKFGDNPTQQLDQSTTGEQKFDYPEGSLYITLDGEMRFEPNRDLDHSAGDIVKNIVVTSGDFDKDSVSATVTLTIQDGDDPVINSVPSVSLSESQLADGSAPSGSTVQATGTISYTEGSDNLSHFRLEPSEFNTDGSLKSNGIVVELREEPADSGQYIGFTTAANGVETTVFTLNFDGTNKGDYTFTLIEALDHANANGNNDLSFALPVYMVDSDGDNSAKADLDITIIDDVQLMQNGSWTISEPNQGENPTTATIDVMPSHSADGATITEFKFGDNPAQQLDQTVTGEQKFDYSEGSLYITLDGEMRFEPNRDLDHENGDIVKDIVVTSGDFDKDSVSATVTLTIQDGDDPVINSVPSVSLSESQLIDGSVPSGSAVQATGTISYTEGSDNLSHFRLEPSEFNTDGSLKSNGLVVELREEPADSGQYIGFTTTANGVETTVFTLDFNNADYTFTLIEAIDHANADGNNDLSFALPVYMVDSDGDNSAKADLDITITDDVQLMQNGAWIITEPNTGDTPTTSTIDVMPAHSADGATISEFKFGDNPTQQLDQSITGEQKFDYPEGSLYITLDGEMRFEPNRDLDHENGDIVKDIVVTSGDFDKDSVSATVTLTIQDGDDPVINTVPSVSLSESQLTDGSAPSGSAVQATGTISYTEGSDNLSHFRLEPSEFNSDGSLKSNGLVVELREEPADSGQYIGFTTAANGVETTVFTLDFNNADYTFTLIEAIDHANADGNNDLSFALPVYMVDSDGDNSAKANLDITITDDVQLMQNGNWTITEPDVGETPTTATFDVMPAHSADGATITEFKFGDNPTQQLNQTVTGEQKFDYPEGSLYITLGGEMRFEPNRDLDHKNGDVVKDIVVTSGDFDKDSVSATVTLTIQDGDDPVINSVPSVSLSESQLIDGSVPSGSAVQATGTITYTEGSDNLSHFRLEPSEFNTDGSLKSNGLVVELREEPAESGQYIGFTTAANGAETIVFTLDFNSADYTFTLIEALDHANADSNNDLSFALPVYMVDSDGDNSAKANLDITITDDVQQMQNGSWTVTEPNQGENPTTATFDVMPAHSADGATITEFKFGDNPTQQLDQTVTGEQKFDYPEGSLYITLDGEIRFEPNRDLDHENGDIVKDIVVTSGDFDKDSVSATVTLTIQDGDDPVINTIPSVSLSEAQLADGSAPSGSAVQATGTISYTEGSDNLSHFRLEPSEFNTDGSLKSNGLVVELREEPADSGQYIGFTTATNGAETIVFTLDFSNADCTFTLIEAIDHANADGNNDLSFALPVYMVDSDGDNSAKADLDITITDDVQLMQNGSWTITEPNQGENPTTATFDVMPAHSADGATIAEFKFGDNPTQQLDQSLTGEQKFDYPEGSLYITLDGEIRFEPNRDLDHENGDIVKNIVVTSGDFDKDSVNATVTLTIQDGNAPVINTVPSVSLSESQLADGSAPSGSAVQATGTISYTEGSDNLSHFRLEPSEFNTDGSLKSNGLVVELREEPADSGQYIGFTTAANGVETTVFTLNFDASNKGDYTFTLIEALDHALSGAKDDVLSFNLPVYAVDSDNDDSVMKPMVVTITDDLPTIDSTAAGSRFSVDENDLSSSSVATGQFEVTAGADDIVHFELGNIDSALSGLHSGGVELTLEKYDGAANTTSYQAVAGNTVVFTLELGDDGSYRFELLQPLDHAPDSDSLTIPFDVVAIDGDGDASPAYPLPISVADDKPIITGTQGETRVDEDDLVGIGSDQTEDTQIHGQFVVDEGADGVTEYQLIAPADSLVGLQSGGESLEWRAVVENGTTFTYVAQTSGSQQAVFSLIFDTSDNSYTFNLLQPVEHPNANEQNQVQIDFNIQALDFDGDKSNPISLPISIVDDVPTLTQQEISRVEGQGFNRSMVNMFDSATDKGADGAELTRIEGTTSSGSDILFKQGGSYVDGVDLSSGSQRIVVAQEYQDSNGNTAVRDLGELRINSNGEVEFRAFDNLEHDGDNFVFTVNLTATDGDKDTSVAPLEITIEDRRASAIPLKVVSFEDSGRAPSIDYSAANPTPLETANSQDNQADIPGVGVPTQVKLQANLYDADNNESIGGMTIKAGQHHGKFFYFDGAEYVELTADNSGKIYFEGSLIDQSSIVNGNGDQITTINNLYFVPDRNYSTTDRGFQIKYQLEIHNDGALDHRLNSQFTMEVESVADIATWDDSNSTYHYVLDEDSSNATLNLQALTQDTLNPETITYQLTVSQGDGHFELLDKNGSPLVPNADGNFIVSSADINTIQVNPNENFSGTIQIDAVAITTESTNAVTDKGSAQSDVKALIFDVRPDADLGSFSVNRIAIFEDNAATQNTVDPATDKDPFTLDEVIQMSPSVDTDGSEVLFVRISNITEGATLSWQGAAPSQLTTVTINGVVYQEVPYDQIHNVEVIPELHSNADFKFDVTGVVKDSASLSTTTLVDEAIIGTKTVNVSVKGVADVPKGVVAGSQWSEFTDGAVSGVETTINESQNGDSFAVLDFSIISGEREDKPLDGSESLTVLLSNIPQGVVIEDSDGTQIDLNFVGYDGSGQPIYEANITGLNTTSGIIVRPVDSSTENIHIKGTVIVTENDGHSREFEQEIRIKVAPVIDASATYTNRSVGDEDTPINIDWHPEGTDYIDDDEHFTSITITGIPNGASVNVNSSDVVAVYDAASGTLTITPGATQSAQVFTQDALANNFIQITPPKDSSTDFKLNTVVEVEERDHEYTSDSIVGEGGRVTATITGELTVVVRPIVEPQDSNNTLIVTDESGASVVNAITANAQGVIRFTTNADNTATDGTGAEVWDGEYVVKYQETDLSSQEVVSDVIVTLTHLDGSALSEEILDQLLVTGAAYEGNGRWVITNEDAFSIRAPHGLDLTPNSSTDDDPLAFNSIKMNIQTLVIDQGEDSNENSKSTLRETTLDLSFPEEVVAGNEVAAVASITPDSVIIATEDNQVDLGKQLDSVISFTNQDGSADEVTIIIGNTVTVGGVTYPISISGGEVDFVNGQFVFQTGISASGQVESFEGLMLNLPDDYSGDFRLPITVITKDTTSGDEKVENGNVIVKVDPIADVTGSEPDISLTVKGSLDNNQVPIDQDGSAGQDPVGYEDSYIQLGFGYQIADQVTGIEGGNEVLSSITLSLADPSVGEFYQLVDNGDGTSSYQTLGSTVTFSQAEIAAGALDNVLFKPQANYPTGNDDNTVQVNVTGSVTDTATFNELAPTQTATDSGSFSTSVSFDVVPVVDPVLVTGPGVDPSQTLEVTGLEDTEISLASSGDVSISLTDLDGSEQFVSIKFTDVPEGFLLTADPSSGYTVKNNGGGEWSVQLPSGAGDSLNLGALSVLPPKHFSGSAEFGLTVFTQESLLGVPTQAANLPNFKINVTPQGDVIDVDATNAVSGVEGENIDIAINASVVDKALSATGNGVYSENAPETVRVEIRDVPSDATIYDADGNLGQYDAVNNVWIVNVAAQQLDKIVFNSGQHNSDVGNALGIDAPLTISVQSVDKDASGNEYLGPAVSFEVALSIDPINDRPTFVNVTDLETQEDTAIAIDNFQIADIDAQYDDPNAVYTLTLSLDKGELIFDPNTATLFDLSLNYDANQNLVISGTVANINAALSAGNISFNPDLDSNDLNSGGAVTVTASVDDGGNNGAIISGDASTSSTNQTTFEIQVTEVNDAPNAADVNLAPMLEEGQIIITAQQLIDASSDPENHTLTVTDLTVAEGQGSLTLNPDGVSWTFTAAQDFNGEVKLDYTIEDNGTTNGANDFKQDAASVHFEVQGVNDKPELDLSSATALIDEAAGQLIRGISVSDVDYVGANSNDLMSVELSVDYGTLSVVLPAGSGIVVNPPTGASITLTGTITELNALLDSPANGNGVLLDSSFAPTDTISLTVVATDSGNPSGMVMQETTQHTITVMPVANSPTLTIDPQYNYVKNISATQTASSNGIALVGIVAALVDSNETLFLQVSGVPAEATLTSDVGTVTLSSGVWTVSADAISSLKLEGADVGNHTLTVTAISQESNGDTASSTSLDLNLDVVIDGSTIDQSMQAQDVQLIGDGGNTELHSGSGDDLLQGGSGNDRLIGGAGDDHLQGGEGDDILEGGLGSDILTGGGGMDTFVWLDIDDGATDTITDFSIAEGDKIDLREVLPELKQASIDMDVLLDHIDAKVIDGADIELTLHPGGGQGQQTILVQDLAPQLSLDGMSSLDIVSSLLDHDVIIHHQ
ncbi:type I secretion protein [Vibrio variabilis]|uniref:Type I secretion protein n=1 Tax=Vibrio variabilis TaxID=990271 RepID=A0ABR4Y967_9VIBR|nr:retention module-containing protein [Vibrio variabilis]KHA59502.1 type I secretion protein [Vibrio variabilis]